MRSFSLKEIPSLSNLWAERNKPKRGGLFSSEVLIHNKETNTKIV
jgi:hypothetical protein